MIDVKNISFSISSKKTLLKDISLTAKAGELLTILGPNGAGKSTLLKMLSGALKPSKGSIAIDGKPIHTFSKPELSQQRAVLSQHYSMTADFLVKDVVMMGRYPHFKGRPLPSDFSVVKKSLETVGMLDLSERNINTLSGGEQQRVHLARVLAQINYADPHRKGLMLLDEPVSSLDIQYQHVVLTIAKEKSLQGHAVISVLHDLNLAAQYADRIIILKQGAKFADDIPEKALNTELLEKVYNIPFQIIHRNGQLLVLPDQNKRVESDKNNLIEIVNLN